MSNNKLKGWLTLIGLILSLIGFYYLIFCAVDFLDSFFVGKAILFYIIGAILIIESRTAASR
jgi:hypothetical protein